MLHCATPTLSNAPTGTSPALWLVRHGESTWNTLGLAQGHRDDAELTERGIAQAGAAAEQFRSLQVTAIFASDLRRALQTAKVFGHVLGLAVVRDARLRERSLGVLEGTRSRWSAHQRQGSPMAWWSTPMPTRKAVNRCVICTGGPPGSAMTSRAADGRIWHEFPGGTE